MAEDRLSYSDIISPDDSISRLIKELTELNKVILDVTGNVKDSADKIYQSLRNTSGATNEGKKAIDEAASAASRLERAQKELAFAESETGKQVAWLKAQISEQNRETVSSMRLAESGIKSYNDLNATLKSLIEEYKALGQATRESAYGENMLNDIIALRKEISLLDSAMKPHIKTSTKLKAATDETRRASSAASSAMKVQSEETIALNLATKEQNRLAKLNYIIAHESEGSYNRLAAQYEKLKIELNKMSAAERNSEESGKKLEAEALRIYQRMIALQEATGKHTLSVGNYAKALGGLRISLNQTFRELPALAVGMNTFFLGISNNIPMVIDQINRLKAENKNLAAEGQPTISIAKSIASAIFSWQTALILVITAFSMWGDKIIGWISSLFKARSAVITLDRAIKNIEETLKKENDSFGKHVVTINKLSNEYKQLRTQAEKQKWIEKNADAFRNLNLEAKNTTQVESILVKNTDKVVTAFMLRAKAAAAEKFAAEEYNKSLSVRAKIEREEANLADARAKLPAAKEAYTKASLSVGSQAAMGTALSSPIQPYETLKRDIAAREKRIEALKKEAITAEKTASVYERLMNKDLDSSRALLKRIGTGEYVKEGKEGRGRQPQDLTKTIYQNRIKILKEYESSVTKLQNDEFAKRRKSSEDQVQDTNNKLQEMLRLNEEYVANVDGKYKSLTDEQKIMIEQQNRWLSQSIINNTMYLALEIEKIQREQAVNTIKIQRDAVNMIGSGTNVTVYTDRIEESLKKERDLLAANLDSEYKLVIDTNKKLLEEGDTNARSEEEIVLELNKKKLQLYSEYDKRIYDARKSRIDNQLKLVKKGSQEELQLLIEQNDVLRKIALSENVSKPAESQVDSAIINSMYEKQAKLIAGQFQMEQLEQRQEFNRKMFDSVKHSNTQITKFTLEQTRERWTEQIRLAEEGSLEWSDLQIAAAKATVIGIDRELSELKDVFGKIGGMGLGGALLDSLGFDDKQIGALSDAKDIIIDNINEILKAEVDAAQQAVEAQQERVEAAQSAYESEVEARNNGYANNVATAKKELEQEKKRQAEKQKILEAAQKRQEAVNTITQASSLVTASANIWAAFSSAGLLGPALAIAAIATMWASFAAAKIKAKQVTSNSEEYGEGGLEFLEGGSHASGNDIDLGVQNKKRKRMKAEGGEALAIINKKQTRKYRKILPDVIDSFNKGLFEEKYLNTFSTGGLKLSINSVNGVNLSKIENDVYQIRKQNESKYYLLPDGTTVIQRGNVTRYVRGN